MLDLTKQFKNQHVNKQISDNYRLFDNGKMAIITTVCPGLSSDDITVWLERKDALVYLRARKNTSDESKKLYNLDFEKCLGKDKIKEVKYTCKDGILTIQVEFDLQDLEKVKVQSVNKLDLN